MIGVSDAWVTGVVGGVTALVVAASTWFGIRRGTSGRVQTTNAETLWEAAEQIRGELRTEVLSLRSEVGPLRVEVAGLREKVSILTRDHEQCQRRLDDAEAELADLRGQFT